MGQSNREIHVAQPGSEAQPPAQGAQHKLGAAASRICAPPLAEALLSAVQSIVLTHLEPAKCWASRLAGEPGAGRAPGPGPARPRSAAASDPPPREAPSPAQCLQQHPQPERGKQTRRPVAEHAESQVPLQPPCVDASGHLETGGETGPCGNYKKCAVALGVTVLVLLITVIAQTVPLSGRSPTGRGPCCPDGWLGYQEKCFYFSTAEGNWTYSQSHCSALGASLAGIDNEQEMDFMLRYKGKPYHWIGLQRDPGQPWKWTNGTEFNNLFVIRGDGDCAYLNNENGVSSSRCTGDGFWICSKPNVFTERMEAHNRSVGRLARGKLD